MITRITWRRWCSRRFTAAAAALLPRPESRWGDAMKAEIEAIEDDRDCLRWAWGCLRTACVRRMGSALRDQRSVRALVAGYLLLMSIAAFWLFAAGVVHQIGSGPAFDWQILQAVRRKDQMLAQTLALAFDSVPVVISFFVSGALLLAAALAVITRRLRTAAELNVMRFALDWFFALGTYLFFPAVSALFLPAHLSLSLVLNVCLTLWLWCARSVERESLGTSAR
jgi:hypothetical protein